MVSRIVARISWRSIASAAVLAASLSAGVANATTVATFTWVSSFVNGGSQTPTGTLQLSLPDTVTTQTFTTPSPGSLTPAQMFSSITALSYTFGDGLSIGLADLNSTTASILPSLFSSTTWYTSAPTTVSLFTGGTATGVFLLSGFTLKGSKVFAGDSRAADFQLAEPAGQQNPANVGLDSNGITPFAGQGVATTDSGYWQLTGVSTVPVPAALPLLFSGLAGLGGLIGRRRRAA